MVSMKTLMTMCLIQNQGRVLLGWKKRGFAVGKPNGFGGKVLPGESIEEGIQREMKEEAGVTVVDLQPRGVVVFTFDNLPEVREMHVFVGSQIRGIPVETEEMRPEWFSIERLPFDQMWPSDPLWIKPVLEGKTIRAQFHYHSPDQMLKQNVEIL